MATSDTNSGVIAREISDFSANPPPSGLNIGIWDIVGILRRRWALPAIGCCLGLLAASVYVVSTPSLYKSTSRILIDKSANRYLQTNKIRDEPVLDDGDVGSQMYVLTSESIVLKVVHQLGLTSDAEFVGNASLSQPDPTSTTSMIKAFLKGIAGFPSATPMDKGAVLERKVISTFEKRLSVSRGDVPSVIEVSFSSEDPTKAADISNGLVEAYLQSSLAAKLTSTQLASRLLQGRLVELKASMTDADEQLNSYKLEHGIGSDNRSALSREHLLGLNAQLTSVRGTVAEAKARFERLKLQMSREGVPGSAIADNDVVKRLRSQYLELVEREAEIIPRVGERHEAVRKLRVRMSQLATAMRQEGQRQADAYENDFNLAVAREGEYQATLAKATAEANSNNVAHAPLRELEQSSEMLHSIYNSVQQKYNEINKAQSEALPLQDARVITRATPAIEKSLKKHFLALAGGILLGLLSGAAAGVAAELLPGGFRSSDQVTQATGFNCVTIVTADKVSKQKGSYLVGSLECVLRAPFSRFTQAFRSIEALVLQSNREHGDQVFCTVSSLSSEGKTFVAGNLASLLAKSAGKRTLIIDCDFHRATLTNLLARNATMGLVEALQEPSGFKKFVQVGSDYGADLLPCVIESRSLKDVDLLGSDQMGELINFARGSYDFIILDAPPMMPVVDVRMLERFVDKFIFVVQWRSTSRRVVHEALDVSPVVRDRMLCLVLNNVLPDALRYIEAYKGRNFDKYYVH